MANINKTKIIKKVLVPELKERGFKYSGYKSKLWFFTNDTGEIDLQIAISENVDDDTLFSFLLIGNSSIWASELNPSETTEEGYFKAENDNEFEALMEKFLDLIKKKGFALLEDMSDVPKERKVSNYLAEYIYENKEEIYKGFVLKYPQIRVDEYSLETISEWFDLFEEKYTFYKSGSLEVFTDDELKELEEVAVFLGMMLEKHLFGKWELYKYKAENSVLIKGMQTLNKAINLVAVMKSALNHEDIIFIKSKFENFYKQRSLNF